MGEINIKLCVGFGWKFFLPKKDLIKNSRDFRRFLSESGGDKLFLVGFQGMAGEFFRILFEAFEFK